MDLQKTGKIDDIDETELDRLKQKKKKRKFKVNELTIIELAKEMHRVEEYYQDKLKVKVDKYKTSNYYSVSADQFEKKGFISKKLEEAAKL
ncbi:1656_t:CDS:2 [Gigaspora margarita]|uniref:1656_t:CDS:1 n=1 Tax=Gigaspora margarita TaxID=4874 RepID=A0ABN7WBT7_GIGMA|nr:1656_t:CDS:2 [Gigaspora margarita]